MGLFLTIIAENPEKIMRGTVLVLQPTSPGCKGIVQALLEDEIVGRVSDEPVPFWNGARASEIQERYLDNPRCAGAFALIVGTGVPTTDVQTGTPVTAFRAGLYIKEARCTEVTPQTCSYMVGGLAAGCPRKMELCEKLSAAGDEAQIPVQILHVRMAGSSRFFCCFPDEISAGRNAGNLLEDGNLNFLEDIIPENESIPATAMNKKGNSAKNSYCVEVEVGQNLSMYYPMIDELVARCVSQSKPLEEKVSYMIKNRFPESLIKMVLRQTPMPFTVSGPVPNPGQKYYQGNGRSLIDTICYMLNGITVQLVGEKGAGKNTLIETACWLLGRPLCRVQGSSELDKMDLLGAKALSAGSTGFVLSDMIKMLRDDGIVVIDEANTVNPEVLTVLHSLTDRARSINIPGYGPVEMGPHACILYTLNENYIGTGEMNAATIDRGPRIIVEQESNLVKLLRDAVPTANESDILMCERVSDEIRKAVVARANNGAITKDSITVRGYIDALRVAEIIPLQRALIENVANKAQSSSARSALANIIRANVD